ncbi:PREDICTED: endoplasmic reticulum metallopeptidase 1-like [Priapulus caudatus]|uniref:Endoplasmic reticulum metallopeptidase 1-like n=1 Tax=Priapulus caudatus TaxID=37621 RepID=A0ABM1EJ06_PRICU|nr:PREDICTED: endoplasmic reticulum metallopeptidase 1-like [Priapulus caudatus]
MATSRENVRFRGSEYPEQNGAYNACYQMPDNKKYSRPQPKLYSDRIWLILLLFYVVVLAVIFKADRTLPQPKTILEARPGEFSEERARAHLLALTDLGDRLVGSDANERLAVDYLVRRLNEVKASAGSAHVVEVDVQKPTGSFTLHFLGGFTSYYARVTNVLVKISPRHGSQHSLLVNCHYDSVVNSPGSEESMWIHLVHEADEALGSKRQLSLASHGFITQHPWAKDVRAFVNLEAAGAGGRELVFQTGPEHPWLISTYARSAVYPYGNVFGQEIFQTGAIPSDTDFRIYRDFGNIPGIDIAYISNGYVYHTKWDHPDFIPPGCVQRAGENLLATVRNLASSPYLAHPGEYRHGNMIFFDVLGVYMVLYPQRVGMVINMLFLLAVALGIARKMVDKSTEGYHGAAFLGNLLAAVVVIVLSWAAAVGVNVLLALLLTAAGHGMSWYSHSYMIGGLYEAPALCAAIAVHALARNLYFKHETDAWKLEAIHVDATMVLWSLILSVLTYHGVCSSYIPLAWVMFPLIMRDRVIAFLPMAFREKGQGFFYLYLASLTFPFLITCYLLVGVYQMFVPVMGRVGTEVIPDVVIAMVAAFSLIIKTNFLSLVFVTRSLKRVMCALLLFSMFTYMLSVFTPLGFPYSGNPLKPTVQRSVIHHIERRFHDMSGRVYEQDCGIWHISFDHLALTPLAPHYTDLENSKLVDCDLHMYCGMPYYLPMAGMMRDTHYLATDVGPHVSIHVNPRLVSRTSLPGNIQRLAFEVKGPDHMIVTMSPQMEVTLVTWSLGDGIPEPVDMKWGEREVFFVFYSHGEDPGSWYFTIDLKVAEGFTSDSARASSINIPLMMANRIVFM